MDEDKIRLILEDSGITGSEADEAILRLIEENVEANGGQSVDKSRLSLQERIDATDDWREKARLSARIVSLGLEE